MFKVYCILIPFILLSATSCEDDCTCTSLEVSGNYSGMIICQSISSFQFEEEFSINQVNENTISLNFYNTKFITSVLDTMISVELLNCSFEIPNIKVSSIIETTISGILDCNNIEITETSLSSSGNIITCRFIGSLD